MHFSLLSRLFYSFRRNSPSQTLQLSRSEASHNLGRRRNPSRFLKIAALLFFGTVVHFHASFFSVHAHLRQRDAGDEGEMHGPLEVSGELSLSKVWEFQDRGMDPRFGCPVHSKYPVFMAFTTTPSRAQLLGPLIRQLLNQTFPVHILLSVAEEYPQFLTEDVRRLHEVVASEGVSGSPRVHILKANRDIGPTAKILYPLSRLQGQKATIIVIDDDQEYSPTLACDLLAVSADYPHSAITRRSRVFPRKHCSSYLASSLIAEETVPISQARLYHGSDLVMGTSGYLVKTSFFGSSVFNFARCPEDVQDTLKKNDDIWVSGHLKRQEIDTVVVLSGYKHALAMKKYYTTGLPEVQRQMSRKDGLWASSYEAQRRSKALHAFFGSFCIPTRFSLNHKQSVCNFL